MKNFTEVVDRFEKWSGPYLKYAYELKWEMVEEWKTSIDNLVPNMSQEDLVNAEKTARKFLGCGLSNYENYPGEGGADYIAFATFSCMALLSTSKIAASEYAVRICNLLRSSTDTYPRQNLQNSCAALLTRWSENFPEWIATELAKEINYGKWLDFSNLHDSRLLRRVLVHNIQCSFDSIIVLLKNLPNPIAETAINSLGDSGLCYDSLAKDAAQNIKAGNIQILSLMHQSQALKPVIQEICVGIALADLIKTGKLSAPKKNGVVFECLRNKEFSRLRPRISTSIFAALELEHTKRQTWTERHAIINWIELLVEVCEISDLPRILHEIERIEKHDEFAYWEKKEEDYHSFKCRRYIERFGADSFRSIQGLYIALGKLAKLGQHMTRDRVKASWKLEDNFRRALAAGGVRVILMLGYVFLDQTTRDTVVMLLAHCGEEGEIEQLKHFLASEEAVPVREIAALSLSYLKGEFPPTEEHADEFNERTSNWTLESNSRTSFADRELETDLVRSFDAIDERMARIVEQDLGSNEERLTGFFLAMLVNARDELEEIISTHLKRQGMKYCRMNMTYRDVTQNRGERKWGADIGFRLTLTIDGKIKRTRGILVQVKKPNATRDGTREVSWSIDRIQRDVLIGTTESSFYLLLGFISSAFKNRFIPSRSIREFMKGNGQTGSIPVNASLSESRSLSHFLVYEFIGGWVGDDEDSILRIIANDDDKFAVRFIFNMTIATHING